jgi:predicted AlkP superfamily pyrophosphatase or phosphodiesterase
MTRPPLLPLLLAGLLGACAYPYTPPALPPANAPAPGGSAPTGSVAAVTSEVRAPVTILVSIDGFRADYLDRGVTPTLDRLRREGVSAPMRPSFPSKTFPNHWTIVTGLHPDHHGIVANTMEDPARPGETFTMATEDPFWWNAAEPVWVTAEKAGIRTATMFWPGSSVAWGGTQAREWPRDITGGTRPEDWQAHSDQVTNDQRGRAVIDWLRRPAAERPRFVTVYFSAVDTAGHQFGPDDPRTTQAIADTDAAIGRMLDQVAALGQPSNVVIVSDHGMAATSSTRVVALDRIVPPADARLVETGPYATFVPTPGREAAVEKALLAPHPHMTCWRKGEIPARLVYGRNPRVPPYLCLAETGWLLNKSAPTATFTGGNHGYDNDAREMRALFVAAGPAFARGKTLGTVDAVDVAPLLRDLLGLPAGERLDGNDRPFRGVLKR